MARQTKEERSAAKAAKEEAVFEYSGHAMQSETFAVSVEEAAKKAASDIRESGHAGQTLTRWETETDSALALAFYVFIPSEWEKKAASGKLPTDAVTGLLDGRKRPKKWQKECTTVTRATLDGVYGRDAGADFAGAPRRIAKAVYGLLENALTLEAVAKAAKAVEEGEATHSEAVARVATFLDSDIDSGNGRTLATRAARTSWATRGVKPEAALDAAIVTYFARLKGTDDERGKALNDSLAASRARAVEAVLGREAAKAAKAATAKAEKAAKKASA